MQVFKSFSFLFFWGGGVGGLDTNYTCILKLIFRSYILTYHCVVEQNYLVIILVDYNFGFKFFLSC